MATIVTISLPNDLLDVWNSIDKKSQWVQEQLRSFSGIETELTHVGFHHNEWMCNPFHKILCRLCMENYEFRSREDYQRLWTSRKNFFLENEYKTKEYISKRFVQGKKPWFPWHYEMGVIPEGEEEE